HPPVQNPSSLHPRIKPTHSSCSSRTYETSPSSVHRSTASPSAQPRTQRAVPQTIQTPPIGDVPRQTTHLPPAPPSTGPQWPPNRIPPTLHRSSAHIPESSRHANESSRE